MAIKMKTLRISENRRFVSYEDGTPFFWLGDTAWELIHKLSREEVDEYLLHRAGLKFNVIQTVILAECNGLSTGNAYGRLPLKQNADGKYDPELPDTDGVNHYWHHVDYVIDRAASLGLYVALLPTWGDKFHLKHGTGPEIFNEQNAAVYGRWVGERYKDRPNVIWVLGGDRPLVTFDHFAIIRAMAQGLREGDQGRHLMTYHPAGCQSSSHQLHHETWLDFNMIQSGHGERLTASHRMVTEDYHKTPTKPTLDAEPCYEDIPIGFRPENGYFDASDVRTAAYYAVFSGAFGHTYGHHSIWSMTLIPGDHFLMHWRDALSRPGAAQMQHLRSLMEAYPDFDRVPDQSLLESNHAGANYMAATRGTDYVMIYSPNGVAASVVMGKIAGNQVRAAWYDPRNGGFIEAGKFPNSGTQLFQPPTSGRGNDWVLLLETVLV